MSWATRTDTYDRSVQDPESGDVSTVTLRPLPWGTVLDASQVELSEGADGNNRVGMKPGERKLLMCEVALVGWTLPLPAPNRDVLRQLNPQVGEQIFYYVDAGEGAPAQLELRAKDGTVVVEGETRGGNGAVPLLSSAGADSPS